MLLRSIHMFSALAVLLVGTSARGQALPGTKLWENPGEPSSAMVAGIHKFLDRELAASVERRQAHWKRGANEHEDEAAEGNRARFVKIIGAVGSRVAPVELSYIASPDAPAKVAESERVSVYAVRWSVYPGVEAEGLLLEPKEAARANVVVMADCDVTPEQAAGLTKGVDPQAQLARLLAEAGCRVLVPTLIDRTDEFSGSARVAMTNQPHREWIYRMAFETGRHVIGYEVDKVRAAIDWFARDGQAKLPVGVVGQGEGGLIAFYSAAVDPRIDAVWVGGYFGPREGVWREPLYRNVFGLVEEFGDAEIARLIRPRFLLVEACRAPKIDGPPPPRNGRGTAATGKIATPKLADVQAEFERARLITSVLGGSIKLAATEGEEAPINFRDRPRRQFLGEGLRLSDVTKADPPSWTETGKLVNPRARMKRQVEQLVDYTQALIRSSEYRRADYWAKADPTSPASWIKSTEPYREAFWTEVIGKYPPATEPLDPRTKQIYDEPKWTGYAVQLPVWPDVVASGILLLPKDLKPGERRPVVVCQHGLEGKPDDVVDPRIKSVYNAFGAELANRGYIVYAPQNPYIGKEEFRLLQRKLNPLKRSLFSVIVPQHERTLEWLATLPQVDPERIGFYGLSYGGKSAMRIPALLKGYCLSICSGDFNEWVVKNTSLDRPTSYMFHGEYEMFEFGLAEGFNYAEMAYLIAPRPFQVERGHQDGCAPDEWIGYEYAKVKRLYDTLNLPDQVDITYFNGGHQVEGKGSFAFLAKHLNWPRGNRNIGE